MRVKRVFFSSVPALIGLFIVIFSWIQLSTSTYHMKLVRYGAPICSIDKHQFESDTCEECGSGVVDTGVFFSIDGTSAYSDDYQLKFTDFYDSYDAFRSDYDMCMSYSSAVFAILVLEVIFYVVLLIRSSRMKTGGRLS